MVIDFFVFFNIDEQAFFFMEGDAGGLNIDAVLVQMSSSCEYA